jgi:hypothetical protein
MYTKSNRHRMHEKPFSYKKGDHVCFKCGDNMVGDGEIFKIFEDKDEVIIQTGNGGRGLEYVKKKDILK